MPVDVKNITPSDQANYLNMGLNLDKVLEDMIDLLNTRSVLYANAAETRLINAQVGQLTAQQAKAYADLQAFIAGQIQINPPTHTQVSDMQYRSSQLDAMTANSVTTDALLQLATAALNDWNQTHT